MEKMRMETLDMVQGNIEKIEALFPNCVTETRGEDGKLKKAVNFNLLRQMLSGDVAEGDEAYEVTWVGKKAAIVEANKPIRKTLRPCPEESVNWDTTENLYIEGDNLEVLKLLQESYLGKVKLIYIDPPYNTGNDFIYRDDFAIKTGEYEEQLGMFDEETGDRLFKNTDSNGRFHSDWCSMIYSRLLLARNVLSTDGVIFISIDDNEVANLRKICDEVFSEKNFLACIIWEKTRKNDSRFFSSGHEYMIVYAKNVQYLIDNNIYFREEKEGAAEIYSEYLRLRAKYGTDYAKMQEELQQFYSNLPKDHPAKKHSRYNKVDEFGVWRDDNMSWPGGHGPTYDVIHPITGKPCAVPPGGWRYSTPEKMQEMIKQGKVVFREDDSMPPIKKTYLVRKPGKNADSDDENVGKQVMGTYFYRSYLQTSTIMEDLLGKGVFEYSKDPDVLKRMIKYVTSDSDYVLDFFSGSASTAHAVMQLNSEDSGHRKFIMVQLKEECDRQSAAYRAGFYSIPEIGKERIRRAGKKIKEESSLATQDLDIGFRVLKLDDSNMNNVYYSVEDYGQQMLDDMESKIKSDRTELDLLFGCLLEWGLPLSLPYKSETIEGCTVHTYAPGDPDLEIRDALIACFDKAVPTSVIEAIARRNPLRAVFREECFTSSPDKINVFETFKRLAQGTAVKVI